jgi:hypothetical protein
MVVRVLASSADAPTSWDLRCEIREQLIAFLRTEHPGALPAERPESTTRPVDLTLLDGPDPARPRARSVPPDG